MIGFNELKKFKYNGSTPKWDMKVSSGIDWFDIKVSASWGDQVMGFKDIRKAIMNGQSFVVLGDGSFGMLPEEWIKKYSNLFKFGIDEKDGLKVSKKQFNIVEMLFDQIDDADILAEIEEKKRKNERFFFRNMLSTWAVFSKDDLRPIDVVDVSDDGCGFQIPAEQVQPMADTKDPLTIRFYFSQDSYLAVIVKIQNSRPYIEKGHRYVRYGCSVDKETTAYEAYEQFVKFLRLFSEHAHKDTGKVSHFY